MRVKKDERKEEKEKEKKMGGDVTVVEGMALVWWGG